MWTLSHLRRFGCTVGLCSAILTVCGPTWASSFAQVENSKHGDPSWQLTNPAPNDEIEGYASQVSIDRGEFITFFVSTDSPSYTLEIFRMGWYNGAGARKMAAFTVAGAKQPTPQTDPETGLIECSWRPSFLLHVPYNSGDPTDWMSGIYLVKLTALNSQKQSYIIFVVRDDRRPSDLLFQEPVNTYEAYNSWGGKSLYTQPRAYKVSFNRPFKNGLGAGDFPVWDLDLVRFLEREGYDVTYTTDVDTHLRGDLLLRHKALLSGGHDEYWSWQMRDNVERARDSGISLAFFGANASYWQIRLERSVASGTPNRTIVCYKDANLDPISHDGNPADRHLATTQFRLPPVNRPEDALIGVMYESAYAYGDLVIVNPTHWIFQGTGLNYGDHLAGLLGTEADNRHGHSPVGTELLARSPYYNSTDQQTHFSEMTVYPAPSGATVFATGTNRWSWGLDTFTTDHVVHTNAAAQQVTRNVLARFLNPLPYYLGPGTVSFPPQLVGTTSATQSVTLVNHTNAALLVQAVVVTGDFQSGGGCEGRIAEGAGCTIEVRFKPANSGTRDGRLTVFTNTQEPQSVSLMGTGLNLSVKLSATHLQFDSQTPGVVGPPSGVALTNAGTDVLEISSIVARGNFIQSNNCPVSLPAGKSCDIFVSFSPNRAGSYSGSLVITDNAPKNPQAVSLSGTCQPASQYGQAKLIYPSQAAKNVPATVPFHWTTVPRSQDSYYLYVGTSLGAADAFKGTPTTAGGVNVKLTAGRHYFARLWTQNPNGSLFEDIAFDTAR